MRRPSPFMLLIAIAPACEGPPEAPRAPTWADVEPILRGQCSHCHGANAEQAGSGAGAIYRFDFFDMSPAVCGEAAQGLGAPPLAAAAASLLPSALASAPGARPRMPPAPAAALAAWERDTLLRWAENPQRGPAPPGNQPPRARVARLPATAGERLSFVLVVDDLDGQSVVGVVKGGDAVFRMDRPGSFLVELDTRTWAAGPQPLVALLCDGWTSARYELGSVDVRR
jgi:hypothetical protein